VSHAYGGDAYAITSNGSTPPPRGVRRLSASLAVGAVAAAGLAVGAFLAHEQLRASPLYADPYGEYHNEIYDMLFSLTFEVVVGVAAVLLLGLCAVLVLRPRSAARTFVLSVSLVMIGFMMIVSIADAGNGVSKVAAAQLPAWYAAVEVAELLIIAALAPVVLYVRRRRFRDFYEFG
jgi:hypothetical protein